MSSKDTSQYTHDDDNDDYEEDRPCGASNLFSLAKYELDFFV